ncbi:MAG: thioredoxin, partial [Bacteroidia bacterium]|nr:thioredoxin [Bacteroidia bacterium]
QLIQSETPVLVDFFATWCGPCQAMSPILKELAGEMKEKVRIVKIDVDRNPAVAQHYQIQGVPTFMLFKEGKMLWKQAGMVQRTQLKHIIESNQ